MTLKGFIFFGLFICAGLLKAQTDFRPGFIVTISGDSLKGMIDYRGDMLMSRICKFKSNDNEILEYSPGDIIAYRLNDGKCYISKGVNGEDFFLECLIKGRVSIYYRRDNEGDHYYVDKEDLKLAEIPYEEGLRNVDGKSVMYKSAKHYGILNYYMQDAPEVRSRIENIKEPERQNLIKLTEDYHKAIGEGDRYIIYEKKLPFITADIELVGGAVKFKEFEDLTDKLYVQGGVIVHIWLPRESKNLYFRTGILYSQVDVAGKKTNLYKVPLHIEYVYPRGIVRPRISYGFNFYQPVYHSTSLCLGANVLVSNAVSLSVSSDIEYESKAVIIPSNFFAYSLNIGLVFKKR